MSQLKSVKMKPEPEIVDAGFCHACQLWRKRSNKIHPAPSKSAMTQNEAYKNIVQSAPIGSILQDNPQSPINGASIKVRQDEIPGASNNNPVTSLLSSAAAANQGDVRIFVGTWNMHGQPPPETLDPLLPRLNEDSSPRYHIIVLGTQECERSIEKSVIYPSKEIWESYLKQYLGARYTLIRSETMAALHLAVFVIQDLASKVVATEGGNIATGIGNVVGNKGAVAVGFDLKGRTFLFINSHFTAHQSHIKERNNDFHRIRREIPLRGFRSRKRKSSKTSELDITDDYDYVFWFGDLNYRVNGTRRMIDDALKRGMLEVLLANDQLLIERKKENVFMGYQETGICFPPTYKFSVDKKLLKRRKTLLKNKSSKVSPESEDCSENRFAPEELEVNNEKLNENEEANFAPDSSESMNKTSIKIDTKTVTLSYDYSTPSPLDEDYPGDSAHEVNSTSLKRSNSVYDSSQKQRIPSWTDRILYKNRPHVAPLICGKYDCCVQIDWSDHKPVFAEFDAQLK